MRVRLSLLFTCTISIKFGPYGSRMVLMIDDFRIKNFKLSHNNGKIQQQKFLMSQTEDVVILDVAVL